MRGRVGDTTARVCIGLLVTLLHLVVLMWTLTTVCTLRETATDSRALTLIDIEAPERTLPSTPPEPKIRATGPSSSAPANVPSSEASTAITTPAAIPDWRGSLEAAATAAVGRAIANQSYQAPGPVEREAAGSVSPPSIFETPRRKAGDIDHDATQGRTMIWHDENCFTELRFPTIKDPNALIGVANPPKCMFPIGKREARGDLFESIEKR